MRIYRQKVALPQPDGTYELDPIAPFGPLELTDSCDTIKGRQFFSNTASRAQRLANGNILVCLFEGGEVIEIDDACLSVWSHDLGGPAFRATRISALDERLEGPLHDGPCDVDLDGDDVIGFSDLLVILATWVPCADCPEDLDEDGAAGFGDLLLVRAAWGPCA